MRVMIAAEPPPSVTAGRIKWDRPSRTETGNKPSMIEKKRINIGPRAKLGSDTPNRLTKLIARSAARPRRTALMTPKGTDTITEKIIDATASSTVAGYRSRTDEENVCRLRKETPR